MWFPSRVRNPALILVQQNVHAFSFPIETPKKGIRSKVKFNLPMIKCLRPMKEICYARSESDGGVGSVKGFERRP